jgi:hypothetical protein
MIMRLIVGRVAVALKGDITFYKNVCDDDDFIILNT